MCVRASAARGNNGEKRNIHTAADELFLPREYCALSFIYSSRSKREFFDAFRPKKRRATHRLRRNRAACLHVFVLFICQMVWRQKRIKQERENVFLWKRYVVLFLKWMKIQLFSRTLTPMDTCDVVFVGFHLNRFVLCRVKKIYRFLHFKIQ